MLSYLILTSSSFPVAVAKYCGNKMSRLSLKHCKGVSDCGKKRGIGAEESEGLAGGSRKDNVMSKWQLIRSWRAVAGSSVMARCGSPCCYCVGKIIYFVCCFMTIQQQECKKNREVAHLTQRVASLKRVDNQPMFDGMDRICKKHSELMFRFRFCQLSAKMYLEPIFRPVCFSNNQL